MLEAYARSYIAYMHDAELAALNVDDVATRTNADERYFVSRQLQQMQQKRHGWLQRGTSWQSRCRRSPQKTARMHL